MSTGLNGGGVLMIAGAEHVRMAAASRRHGCKRRRGGENIL